jgi:hypothetical protein
LKVPLLPTDGLVDRRTAPAYRQHEPSIAIPAPLSIKDFADPAFDFRVFVINL